MATLLLKEGVDINDELKNVSIDHQIIENIVVVEVILLQIIVYGHVTSLDIISGRVLKSC